MSNTPYPVYIVDAEEGILFAHLFKNLDVMVSHYQGRFQNYHLPKSMRNTGASRLLMFSVNEYFSGDLDEFQREEDLCHTNSDWKEVFWHMKLMRFRNGLHPDFMTCVPFETIQRKVYARRGTKYGNEIHTVSQPLEDGSFMCITKGIRTFTTGLDKWFSPMNETRYGLPVHVYWLISDTGSRRLFNHPHALSVDELTQFSKSGKSTIPKNAIHLSLWRFINRLKRSHVNKAIKENNQK